MSWPTVTASSCWSSRGIRKERLVLHSSKPHANHRLVGMMMVDTQRQCEEWSCSSSVCFASSARRVVSHRDTD